MRHLVLYCLCLAGLLTGCQPPPKEVIVAVYASTLACVINDKPIRCEETAIYLRDTLKIPANRRIYISAVSSDPVPKDNPLLDRIAEGVRKVGYTDVRTSNFDFK